MIQFKMDVLDKVSDAAIYARNARDNVSDDQREEAMKSLRMAISAAEDALELLERNGY